ncbi:hypothetical protein [Acinetobacter soli]|uniref:hypothetical protein n=1 Tax=Acinetobacter soli TaxID=487316 RepID=UPI000DD0EDB0|nr:hypothetical protein [Acinetobacter soli]RSB53661.1 hypothetical protein EGK59_08305 [Acinetobacter soli]
MIDEKLYKIVESALECFREELPSYGVRQNFPKNSCEEVSSILLNILETEGYVNFKMIKGSNKKGKHHFWLESDIQIIDLTAHQFEGISIPFLLIDKNEYPLNKIFCENIRSEEIDTNWPYLSELLPRIKNIFYRKYYK